MLIDCLILNSNLFLPMYSRNSAFYAGFMTRDFWVFIHMYQKKRFRSVRPFIPFKTD